MRTKFFNFLRVIAFAALVCTLAVTVFMLVEAATPADKSSVLSSKFSGDNGGEVVVEGRGDEVPTQGLSLKYSMDFSGATVAPTVTFIPDESTDRELIWERKSIQNGDKDLKDDCITLNTETGELNYHHLGTIVIKVSLKSDPKIYATYPATCLGTAPSEITSLEPTQDTFKQGEQAKIRMRDQNGELVAFHMFEVKYDGDCFTQSGDDVTAKKVGTTIVTVSHPDMADSFSFPITVVENPKYVELEKFVPDEKMVPDGQTYFVKPNVTTDFRDLFKCDPIGSDAFQTYSFSIKNPKGKTVLEKTGSYIFRSNATGEAKLTIKSRMDPSISITFNVCVYVDKPTSLQIITSDIIIVDRKYSLKTMGSEFYMDNVTYEVIKGKATLDGSTFRPTRLGKLVIRATYDDDPTLYTDITLDVKLFDTFAAFVRKAIGHFMLFAVLGFGFSFVYLFLFKKRLKWVAAPLALPTGLLLAMASEGLQMTAEGRYASWTDVGVDFVGFGLGIAVAFIVLAIILFIFRLTRARHDFFKAFSAVSAKTLFRSASSEQVQSRLEDKKADGKDEIADGSSENSSADATSNGEKDASCEKKNADISTPDIGTSEDAEDLFISSDIATAPAVAADADAPASADDATSDDHSENTDALTDGDTPASADSSDEDKSQNPDDRN